MIKVMTLNINYYGTRHGPWSVRRELIAEAIRKTRPDLVALQAVRKDPEEDRGIDQATQLANLVPNYRHVFFQPAVRTPDGGEEGSAIISRYRFAGTSYQPLTLIPDREDTNHRVLLMACLDLRVTNFYVFNGHFSWVDEQAESNVNEAIPFIDAHKGPGLLVGDMNQTPDSPIMHRLAHHDWTDAWAMLRPHDDGYTFETGNLTKRIDYAWASYEMVPHLRSIEIVATNKDTSGADVSDHLGLMVSVDLVH